MPQEQIITRYKQYQDERFIEIAVSVKHIALKYIRLA